MKRRKLTKRDQELGRKYGFTDYGDSFHEEYETLDFKKMGVQPEQMLEMDDSLKLLLATKGNPTPEQWATVTDWRPTAKASTVVEQFTMTNDKEQVNEPSVIRPAPGKPNFAIAQPPEPVVWTRPLSVEPTSLCEVSPELVLSVEQHLGKRRSYAKWLAMKQWALSFYRLEPIDAALCAVWFFSPVYTVFVALVMQRCAEGDWKEIEMELCNFLLVPQIKLL
jgi:hypothetical protein